MYIRPQNLVGRQIAPIVEALEGRQLLSSVSLDFNGAGGGIANTGFTSVLATSGGTGYIKGDVALSGGALNITSTAGDMYVGGNTQDDALDLGLDATRSFTVQSRILSPAFAKDYQSGGIFVGTDEDNYVKFVVGSIGQKELQVGSEIGGVFTTAIEIKFPTTGVNTLDLRLVGDPAGKTLVAQYRVNSDSDSAWVTGGTVTNPAIFSAAAKVGILTTNTGAAKSVKVSFDSFSVTAADPAVGLVAGANSNATHLSGSEAEAQIAVNPTNALNQVIVSQTDVNNGNSLIVSRTIDGGKTWTTSMIGSAQDGFSSNTQRPDGRAIFDAFGNLYVSYLVGGSDGVVRIMVARSTDGGATFSSDIAAVANSKYSPDAPTMATGIDATKPSRQVLFIAFTDYATGHVELVSATATGLGKFGTFSAVQKVSSSLGAAPCIAVGPNGEVAVAWQPYEDGSDPTGLYLNVDPDGTGSARFGSDLLVTRTNVGAFFPLPAQPDRTIDAEPKIAFDRSGGPANGRLYFVYTDAAAPNDADTDILLRYSDDLGASWSQPVTVNDDASGKSRFLPGLAVDDATGNVGITWYDARNSAGNNTAELYAAVSIDHGLSLFSNVRVSVGTSNQSWADPSENDLDFGDLSSAAFANGKLVAVWSDNSNSTGDNPDGTDHTFDVYTAAVSIPGMM